MFIQHVLLALLWVFFSLFHSIFASEKWKLKMKAFMKYNYKYYRLLYSAFALITLTGIIFYHLSISTFILWQPFSLEIIFAVTGIITGALLMLFFAKKFFFELSGADVFLKTKRSEKLLKTSLYNYVRHPLYTATLIFIWSIFLLHPSLSNIISSICITVYTIVGIYFEEKKLISDFGESYVQYRAVTPMLIPHLSTIINGRRNEKRNVTKH
ncbi:MAG: isoprenylcysteine carboxylmethyltransferase family protein [Parafilimonas sp.]|nr:isoprenylcysteine carboxylmethyltransferase family protein [Parafilimonas sp.]